LIDAVRFGWLMQPAACDPMGFGECIPPPAPHRELKARPTAMQALKRTSRRGGQAMQNLKDPKGMARSLREQMRTRGVELSHGECLEIVARQLGDRDWNVLAARNRPRSATVVRVQHSCEWVASNDGREVGRLNALRRPDARWFIACDTWFDAVHDALVMSAAEDLQQDLYASVHESDDDHLARHIASGFAVQRREIEFTIPVERALRSLGATDAPAGYRLVSAADIDEVDLRVLDDALRADIPGSDGWVNQPQEFREYTFAAHFDPTAYLVAVDDAGRSVGLVRIWKTPLPRRLGLIAVMPGHRRHGLARALVVRALQAVQVQGVTSLAAEVDAENAPSLALFDRMGAERTGGTVELRRPFP
jgi:ribosomal protein S18 acetylase RimI-like enzyme